jgi:sporulation protein YlmC with PRC-barrel domain
MEPEAMKQVFASLLAASMIAGWSTTAPCADKPVAKDQKILVAKTFRASALAGLNVRNKQGEKLGTVHDLVIDIPSGKVAYVALSVGGVLGVGDKLFAVPYDELKFDHGNDEMFFVLDMSKQKLEAAPGFDQSDWPDFANPHWSDQIDKYYREARKQDVRSDDRNGGVE